MILNESFRDSFIAMISGNYVSQLLHSGSNSNNSGIKMTTTTTDQRIISPSSNAKSINQPTTPTTIKTRTHTDFSIDAILGNTKGNSSKNDNNNGDNTDRINSSLSGNNDDCFERQRARKQPTSSNKRPRPKKYQCPFCWVALSNTGQFRGHIRIHTGERPFKCDQPFCQKTFTRNEELTRHKRIHTGQRPYACELCNKHFGRKDHLKKHIRTHDKHTQNLNSNSSRSSSTCSC